MATRFGSARLLKSPLVVSARISASMLALGLNKPTSIAPCSAVPSRVPFVAPRQSPLSSSLCGLRVSVCVLKLLTALRLTSAKRTWSSTCTASGVLRLSMIVAPLPLAISTARLAELASRTWPERVTELPVALTLICSSGSSCRR